MQMKWRGAKTEENVFIRVEEGFCFETWTEDHECDRRQIAVATAVASESRGELAAIRMQTEAVTVWRHGLQCARTHSSPLQADPVWQTRSSKASMRQAIRQCAQLWIRTRDNPDPVGAPLARRTVHGVLCPAKPRPSWGHLGKISHQKTIYHYVCILSSKNMH